MNPGNRTPSISISCSGAAWCAATSPRGPTHAMQSPSINTAASESTSTSAISRPRRARAGPRHVTTCRAPTSNVFSRDPRSPPSRARRGREMAEIEVLRDAAVLIDGDRIAWVGPRADVGAQHAGPIREVEVNGVLFPGFIDCHTHGVFGAPRLDDHERRALGVDYKAIGAAGGGIMQSVHDVRARPEVELATLTRSRLTALLKRGATTIEVKSGYGLELEAELKQLRVVRQPAGELSATLIPTFLGAHEVPPEYRGKRAEYVRLICEEMIP